APRRLRVVSSLTRHYPLTSGHMRVANGRVGRWLAGPDPWVADARLHDGSRLDVVNDQTGRAVALLGDIDRKVSTVIQRFVRPGDCVLDVGANLGVMTLYAARRVGSTGLVHAFEPQTDL